jgi:excisionase family DNA binding protein
VTNNERPDITAWLKNRYEHPDWQKARVAVRARDKTCRTCGGGAEKHILDVHHISYPTSDWPDIDHLILLCRDCHSAVTSVIQKRRKNAQKQSGVLKQEYRCSPSNNPNGYSLDEVAHRLRISRTQVKRLIAAGTLQGQRIGGNRRGTWLIRIDLVDQEATRRQLV